jgi:hypothetical protein
MPTVAADPNWFTPDRAGRFALLESMSVTG